MTRTRRSGHKKSTTGCTYCKKRHLKCDENRPSCVNCATQGRRCPYLDEQTCNSEQSAPNTSSSLSSPNTRTISSTPAVKLDLPKSSLELPYVILIQQWLNETHRSFVFNSQHADIYGSTTFNYALINPFLMKSILALSALHLSIKHHEKRDNYLEYAVELQSQGLADFNTNVVLGLNERTILPAFLFSTITVAHQMAICLSEASDHSNHNNTFLELFINCLKVSRGVNIVLQGWWDALTKSELQPILSVSDHIRGEIDVEQETSEFDMIRQMIQSFESANSTAVTNTYLATISKLQWAFNMQKALNCDELNSSISWAFAWPINISAEFTELLEMRRPEAIVILAHYTPLLHFRRSSWVVREASVAMFRALESSLGPNWSVWLQWPREVFAADDSEK